MDDYNFEHHNLIITPFDYDYGTYDTELKEEIDRHANLQYNVDIYEKGETLFDNGYWDTIPGITTDLEIGLGEFQQIHVGEKLETSNIEEATSKPELSTYEQEFQDALRDCLGKLYVEPNATCQPNVQFCSHHGPDLPKSRKRRCHNDLVIPKKVSKKDEPKWCDNEDEEKPDDLQKPFSFYTLVTLAILNAPEKRIATNQVYYFLLHHFPYFRYANHNWENSVRNAITGSGTKGSAYFMKVGEERVQNKHKITVFGFKNEELAMKRARDEIEKYNAEEELRGREFYQKMLLGEIGLPRQLFYHIIAHTHRTLAGPENSALFYHMLACRQLPHPVRHYNFFRVYNNPHNGSEPKFYETYLNCNDEYKKNVLNYTSFGDAVGPYEETVEIRQEDANCFHENIILYFDLQRQCQMQFPEYCKWQTPSVSDVYNLVLKPSEQRLEFKARKEAQMEVDRCENRKKRVWHPIEQVLSSRRLLQNVPVSSNLQFNTQHINFPTNGKMPDASQTTYTTGWTNYPLVQS